MTLQQVSEYAGVSIATVSRVVNNNPRVSPATRARVERAIRQLNYAPSFAGRTLAKQSTDMLGVIFPNLDAGFFAEVLKGINEEAAKQEYHLMVAFGHGPADEIKLVRQYVSQRRVDALVVMNLDLPDRFLSELAEHPVPVVALDRPAHEQRITAICLDNASGAKTGMQHLLVDHGYQRIAVLTGPNDSYDSQHRLAGCLQAVREAGRPKDFLSIWPGDFTEQSGYDAVDLHCRENGAAPQAIFALNDPMALGAIACLREHGLRVPEDVAVVGFDDVPMARHLGLTTVRIPMMEMGRLAVRAALARIRKTVLPEKITRPLPTQLVVRRSCGCVGHEKVLS